MSFVSQLPILNDINNQILSGRGAMPAKNNTSDGTADFSNGREYYRRSFQLQSVPRVADPNNPTLFYGQSRSGVFGGVNGMFFRQSARSTTLPSEPPKYQEQKKWIGGNRDASSIVEKRRTNTIGVGTLNANGTPMQFMSGYDANVNRQALTRVRAGGATVPKKTQMRSMNRSSK